MRQPDPGLHETTLLLQRVKRQDQAALGELLRHLQPRIDRWVRRKRSPAVRARFETQDCSQDVVLNLIQYLPTMLIRDSDTFHALLYRMILNSLNNKQAYLMASRRRLTRERPLQTDASIALDPVGADTTPPDRKLEKSERDAWIRCAMSLLSADDQELIFRHHYDGQSFVEIGELLKSSPDAIRMRFNRAMTRMLSVIMKLREGRAAEVAGADEEEVGEE